MVETATGVVEEVGKRVVGTAASLLEKAGVDVAEVERRLGGQFPPSVETLQTLAGEAVTAGRAGVDLAVGVARSEAEKVFEKVGDQVTKVGVVLAYLETKLREVEEESPAATFGPESDEAEGPVPAPRAGDLFGRGWEFEDERSTGEPIVAERVEVDEPVEVDPPVPPVSSAPSASVASPVRREEPAVESGSAPAGKPAAKKSTAKKSTAKTGAAEKSAVETTAAKRTAAKKTTVKKTAAKKTAAKKTAAKSATARKTTVRKTSSTKKPDARDE
ncbi:histone H1-like repetitive region-containing protein [Kitasatospora brasiliensis]|uniref:histone H1-like repetitive region-containing protein n=1 Tax=Kitasatospora brasiliensis TaxID=3058040 RepID=UPI0029309040|nr:histone H1-like repetitive region-containing protein [Kitasatospora sp. K002]